MKCHCALDAGTERFLEPCCLWQCAVVGDNLYGVVEEVSVLRGALKVYGRQYLFYQIRMRIHKLYTTDVNKIQPRRLSLDCAACANGFLDFVVGRGGLKGLSSGRRRPNCAGRRIAGISRCAWSIKCTSLFELVCLPDIELIRLCPLLEPCWRDGPAVFRETITRDRSY